MKRFFLFLLVAILFSPFLNGQGEVSGQDETGYYAITLSATRLFEDPGNLSSVILIIPKGETVRIFSESDDHYLAEYKGSEGYIRIDNTKFTEETRKRVDEEYARSQALEQREPGADVSDTDRLRALTEKYGVETGDKIFRKAIWKGMDRNMVLDSWGKPLNVRRYYQLGRTYEEWTYKPYRLFFDNGMLVRWSRVR